MPENYIGIMCGTSLDSLDFSLCCFEKVRKLKTFKSYRINQKLRDKINLCKTKPNNLSLFDETDKEVTNFIISCLLKFITFNKLNKIKAIELEKACEEKLAHKGVYPNVDFYSGILYKEMDIPTDIFTPIFAMSRVSGWLSHWIEQIQDNKIFRPTQNYVGSDDREYTDISGR